MSGAEMTTGLRRFAKPAPRARPGERCELCTEALAEEHPHVIDLETRTIMCACRGCYLLFTPTGAGGNRLRAVPDRYLHVSSFQPGEALWEATGIPVGLAFLFRNSVLDTAVAFYPSPAGATESLLPLHDWQDLLDANPALGTIRPDVEALLINRRSGGFECFVVPIDRCYELVGLVRLHWRGFDGGTEARRAIEEFLAGLRARAEPVTADG
jgi:Family of unknown function (DUF5947)